MTLLGGAGGERSGVRVVDENERAKGRRPKEPSLKP